eukprot:117132-Chlamydomonas_euryale.AAC.8
MLSSSTTSHPAVPPPPAAQTSLRAPVADAAGAAAGARSSVNVAPPEPSMLLPARYMYRPWRSGGAAAAAAAAAASARSPAACISRSICDASAAIAGSAKRAV